MAKGRPPLPKNVHLLRGNPSKLSPAELAGGVNPTVEIPQPPAHLSGEALAEWDRITSALAKIGLVSTIDRGALAMYCQHWATYVHAQEKLAELKGELVVRHPNGFEGPSPWLAIAAKAGESCRRLLVEFGMSPSSRSRVKAGSQPDLFGDDDGIGSYFR